jgi:hypothetical protein
MAVNSAAGKAAWWGSGMAGGDWRQLEDSTAGSAITAIYAVGATIWRSSWHLEALEERKEKKEEQREQRRQRRHNSATMVDAAV